MCVCAFMLINFNIYYKISTRKAKLNGTQNIDTVIN